jgi:ABC-type multidrug transport system fused ATPase/permease subunit
MNILIYLFQQFFNIQKGNMLGLLGLSLFLSYIYTKVSSKINAKIIQSIQLDKPIESLQYFWFFIAASIVYIILLYVYKYLQNHLLTNLTNWVKKVLFEFILKSNNEDMKNINFADFITPITRISSAASSLLNDFISNLIPTLGFMIVIIVYFMMNDLKLGMIFLIGNVIIFGYLAFFWNDMFLNKKKQEELVVENERYILDSLNNIDKIIYRGMVNDEIKIFDKKTDECIRMAIQMTQYVTNHMFIMNIFIYIIIFSSMYYILQLNIGKRIDNLTAITFLTILIIYRDNISDTVQSVPHNIDLMCRIDFIVREFNEMINEEDVKHVMDKQFEYESTKLPFNTIEFKNVSFKYPYADKPVFENYSKTVEITNKIIGIIGPSGNGKSSFVKLILRLHDCTGGVISIDDQDIKTINPDYIRENITYVNQNSRLFDREILTNILYGCTNPSKCNENLKTILAFDKIKDLYKNVDLEGDAGPLGENLSGGQRQVANLISGLINPTPILVLDEPTNALDPELKHEILSMIQYFRTYKKCIMIITHDKEVYQLFDETINI